MKHRVLAWLLVIAMAVGLLGVPAAAISPDSTAGDWKYELTSGGISLTEYLGSDTKVTVPEVLGGQRVIVIGTGCFRGNTDLTEVEISHGIRVIGEEAFRGCSELKKVRISGSVNEIGARAFAGTGLVSAVIPGSVRTIGEEAFLGCEKLYNIVIEEGVEDWTMVDIGDDFGSGSVTLVEGIEIIGKKAFYDCINLTRMRVPATVKSLGEASLAYADSGRLSGYHITGFADTEAERYAVANGIEFVAVEPADPNSGICGEDVRWSFEAGKLTISGTGRMYDYTAADCLPWFGLRDQITCAVIEEGVTSLGEYTFSDSAVSRITLPLSLAFVGKEAFGRCDALTEITFHGDAPEFAENAFLGTTVTAWYPGGNGTWTAEVRKDYGGDVTWKCEGGLPFVDVPVGAFYYDPVAWAVEKGITTGTDASHFSPNADCQRAAVVTFLWRAMDNPAPKGNTMSFVDVPEGAFFRDPVQWAVEQNITSGTDTTHFSPYMPCNRAQVVTFLWRTMGCPEPESLDTPFTDVDAGSWYGHAVAWAVEEGITTGMSADVFGVNNVCNRAQIVTFLYRTIH